MTDTATLTLTDFLLARITEDEAAAAEADGHPGLLAEYPAHLKHLTARERQVRLQAIALDLRCPTCHAAVGEACMAMTPPAHAPKPAEKIHSTRRDLAAGEMQRRTGGARHCDRWTMTRVLAECEAKREVIGQHIDEGFGQFCMTCVDRDNPAEQADHPCPTMRILAWVYADHPDYREDWRP